jgi:hypothetical protein
MDALPDTPCLPHFILTYREHERMIASTGSRIVSKRCSPVSLIVSSPPDECKRLQIPLQTIQLRCLLFGLLFRMNNQIRAADLIRLNVEGDANKFAPGTIVSAFDDQRPHV